MTGVITFNLSERMDEIDEEAVGIYLNAKLRVLPILDKEVVSPIEEAIKGRIKYSDENIPSQTIQDEVKVGERVFVVKTIPTEKSPTYQQVFDRINEYLCILDREHRKGIKRAGVLTIEDRGFVDVGMILDTFLQYKRAIVKEGVRQEIKPNKLERTVERIAIPIIDFSRLPPRSGDIYLEGMRFYLDEKSNAITNFEDILKLKVGVDKDNIPDEPVHYWEEGNSYLMHVLISPKESTKYGEVVNALISDKKTKEIDYGDLYKIVNDIGGLGGNINVKARGERFYVPLRYLRDRMKYLTKKNSSKTVQTDIRIYPAMSFSKA